MGHNVVFFCAKRAFTHFGLKNNNGKNYFSLWSIKTCTLVMQRDLGNALKDKDSLLAMLSDKKKDLLEWVNSFFELSRPNDFMRGCRGE